MQELEDVKNYNFGLNEHHQSHIMNYLKFARQQRMQAIKAVEYSFTDVMESRLLEDTYTGDEVRELLTGLLRLVQGEVEAELMDAAHSNALLLKQLCSQAEAWHLRLQPDLSELHSRRELEALKGLDRGCPPAKPCSPAKLRLAPLAEGPGPAGRLRQEVDQLGAENARLARQLADTERQLCASRDEADLLREAMEAAARRPEQTRTPPTPTQPDVQPGRVDELEAERGRLRGATVELERSRGAQQRLERELAASREQAEAAAARLVLAEQELERKFSETAAYANLKKMLSKKNEQIKELRAKLQATEPSTDAAEETVV
ncbi:leucine zipper transcription factor-like protein 1 isoform X2 [Bacillus rossius redtenbacheri]|uniref:leucine zipper transcription factor-like protein 1 isoform X2 n=1 Tax=Bacillus rossius redtenbacheri TaxID=93214 RepID=UPI002FDD5CEA